MRRLLSFVLTFSFVVTVFGIPASGQQTDIGAIHKRFEEFYNAGNYAAALLEAQRLEAAVKARFGVNRTIYAAALSNLAIVYENLGKFTEAEGLHRRALMIKEKALGSDHPDV